jgi:hypothetical protein
MMVVTLDINIMVMTETVATLHKQNCGNGGSRQSPSLNCSEIKYALISLFSSEIMYGLGNQEKKHILHNRYGN